MREIGPDEIVPEGLMHPAKFSASILKMLDEIVTEYQAQPICPPQIRLLDPFAGTGKVHTLQRHGVETFGVEIEPEWAAMHPRTTQGNALLLPWPSHHFHMVVTSPAYGNRLADSHKAKDGSLRRSYAHDLRRLTRDPDRDLHPDNLGGLHFGPKYQELHIKAWQEVWRVLRPTGWFVLNVSDSIKNFKTVPVAQWHRDACMEIGFNYVDEREVPTPRLRVGSNSDARVASERIYIFEKPGREPRR